MKKQGAVKRKAGKPGKPSANQDGTKPPEWLVMVYMQAGDSSQLDSLAVQDLLEMERGAYKNKEVEVLVEIQRKWPSDPQRYYLKNHQQPQQVTPKNNAEGSERPSLARLARKQPAPSNGAPANMGARKALATFLKDGFKIEAEHYCLVLWGHAFGLGFGRFHSDPLTLEEIQGALDDSGRTLEVLATNACTMSYIEAAYQLHDKVEYLVASQAFVPLTGLPYRRILRGITPKMKPLDLAKMIADRYVDDFNDSRIGEGNAGRDEKVAMTVLNLNGDDVSRARDNLDSLARAITSVIGADDATNFDRLDEIRDVFLANPAGDVRPVLDLYSLTNDLIELCDDCAAPKKTRKQRGPDPIGKLRKAADALSKVVRPPCIVVDADGTSSQVPQKRSIVTYHRKHPDLEGMSGVGVFAPFVVDQSFLKELELNDKEGEETYRQLRIFAKDTVAAKNGKNIKGAKSSKKAKHASGPADKGHWISLVYGRLRAYEDDLEEIVDASGVVRRAQRIQVNQLVRAVDAAFNKLDRVIRKTEGRVVNELKRKRNALLARKALGTFGRPHLKLAGDLSLLDGKDRASRGLLSPLNGVRNGSKLHPVVSALVKIERALQLVEKTTRRVITNRTFGLGPPSPRTDGVAFPIHLGPKPAGGELGPKPAGGELGPKPAGGELGPKPAGGELGPKPAGGELGSETGAYFAYMSPDPQVASLAVCTLIGLATSSLVQLERATFDLEGVAAQFLFKRRFGPMLSRNDYTMTIEEECVGAFGALKEAALQARRTIRHVLGHPVYGLGLGPESFGQAERDALASSSGLNRRNLALLSGTP